MTTTATCCVVYTTDAKYLFPTLVSAIQARIHSSRSKADVIIFCFGLDPESERVFAPICAQEQIGLIPVDKSLIEGQTSMLARLFLNRFVPAQYTQYLYLDGDVHILDSIDPLIDADVPEGFFLAANDPMTFLLADTGPQSRDLAQHLRSLGLTPEQSLHYFNSGVLRINRNGWDEIGLSAWDHFRTGTRSKRFPDQDALNVVGVDKRLPLSLAWNYPVFMRNSRVESRIKPRIKHFMSSPKPWNGAFPPWTEEACTPYKDALTAYPQLLPYNVRMSARSRAAYHFQQHGKKLIERVTWGLSQRRSRILRYEAKCNGASQLPIDIWSNEQSNSSLP
jgi:lipopolysaccharide biosynthesis glycosyltransferase